MSHASALENPDSLGDQSTTGASSLQEDSPQSPLTLVCSACRAGPFSYEGFRQAVLDFHYDETTGYCYTTTWSEISQSANEACSWCRIVIRSRDGLATEKFPLAGEDRVEVRFQVCAGKHWRNVKIFINGHEAAIYNIYANAGDIAAKEIDTVPNYPKEGPYVDCPQALECIKQCSTHEHCPAIEETYLPTRVIDCSDPSKPRLVETHRQVRGHYCALSYVWGGNQLQKTTNANIRTYVDEGINIPLPQTIADAISVTNRLGIRYLWVDALCIIQDSNEDKINELGIMANIYRNAFLTIAAQSAFRADQGFLPDERAPDILPFYPADSMERLPGRMVLECTIPGPWLLDYVPLEDRGWCLQESALSPRILFFSPPFLSYKCRSFNARSVMRGSTYLSPANDHILFPTNKNHCSASTGGAVGDHWEELYRQWRRVLLDYSKRKITVPSDKFVALASITELFQTLLKDQYVAGLWRRNLFNELLWEVEPPMGPDEALLPRPADYRAPTWSWASVDRKLRSFNPSYPPSSAASYEAEILVCEATPKISSLPFGEITDARLTMRVKMHPLMRDGRRCSFVERKGTGHVSLGGPAPTSWSWSPPPGHCLEPNYRLVDGVDDEGQKRKEIREVELTFDSIEGTEQNREMDFHVVILRAGRQGKSLGDWIQGLLVLPVDGEVDQYRRVAKLDLGYPFEWPDWFDSMRLKTVTLI